MNVDCPFCQASISVSPENIPSTGRPKRCVNCFNRFQVRSEADALVVEYEEEGAESGEAKKVRYSLDGRKAAAGGFDVGELFGDEGLKTTKARTERGGDSQDVVEIAPGRPRRESAPRTSTRVSSTLGDVPRPPRDTGEASDPEDDFDGDTAFSYGQGSKQFFIDDVFADAAVKPKPGSEVLEEYEPTDTAPRDEEPAEPMSTAADSGAGAADFSYDDKPEAQPSGSGASAADLEALAQEFEIGPAMGPRKTSRDPLADRFSGGGGGGGAAAFTTPSASPSFAEFEDDASQPRILSEDDLDAGGNVDGRSFRKDTPSTVGERIAEELTAKRVAVAIGLVVAIIVAGLYTMTGLFEDDRPIKEQIALDALKDRTLSRSEVNSLLTNLADHGQRVEGAPFPSNRRLLPDKDYSHLFVEDVEIIVRSTPEQAAVTFDGQRVGVTPLHRKVPRDVGVHSVVVTKPGFAPYELSFTPNKNYAFDVELKEAKPERRRAKRPARRRVKAKADGESSSQEDKLLDEFIIY
jgi:predicted Zn finger-like uncharacterized protein